MHLSDLFSFAEPLLTESLCGMTILISLVITITYKGAIMSKGDFLYVDIWAMAKDNHFARFNIAMLAC